MPATARCLRPDRDLAGDLAGTVPAVAERSSAIVLMSLSTDGVAVLGLGHPGMSRRMTIARLRGRGGTRRGAEIGRQQRAPGPAVDEHRIGLGPGFAVDDDDARSLGREVL